MPIVTDEGRRDVAPPESAGYAELLRYLIDDAERMGGTGWSANTFHALRFFVRWAARELDR